MSSNSTDDDDQVDALASIWTRNDWEVLQTSCSPRSLYDGGDGGGGGQVDVSPTTPSGH